MQAQVMPMGAYAPQYHAAAYVAPAPSVSDAEKKANETIEAYAELAIRGIRVSFFNENKECASLQPPAVAIFKYKKLENDPFTEVRFRPAVIEGEKTLQDVDTRISALPPPRQYVFNAIFRRCEEKLPGNLDPQKTDILRFALWAIESSFRPQNGSPTAGNFVLKNSRLLKSYVYSSVAAMPQEHGKLILAGRKA